MNIGCIVCSSNVLRKGDYQHWLLAVDGSVLPLTGSCLGHLAQFMNNVIVVLSLSAKEKESLIIEGVCRQFVHRPDQGYTGDTPQFFDGICEYRHFLIRLVVHVCWRGLWLSCVIPVSTVAQLQLWYRIGPWVRLVVRYVGRWSLTSFSRYRD